MPCYTINNFSRLQNDFAPMAELARLPSPAGKGDREAVDEENE